MHSWQGRSAQGSVLPPATQQPAGHGRGLGCRHTAVASAGAAAAGVPWVPTARFTAGDISKETCLNCPCSCCWIDRGEPLLSDPSSSCFEPAAWRADRNLQTTSRAGAAAAGQLVQGKGREGKGHGAARVQWRQAGQHEFGCSACLPEQRSKAHADQ